VDTLCEDDSLVNVCTNCSSVCFYRHFHRPIVPVDLNYSSFNGLVVHSHDYREPETFRDMAVIVLGAGLSGIDISIEVSQLAKKVT
jgi:cation diffusion facilitator CzcD-associated flavoprotein CzcO